MKLKVIPTLREKKRYVVFKVYSSDTIEYDEFRNAAINVMLKWMGEKGFGEANIKFIKNLWNEKEMVGFVKCSTRYVHDVKFAFGLLRQVGDAKVLVRTVLVSGTISSAKRKLKNIKI